MFALLPHRAALETPQVSWQKVQYITASRGSADPPLSAWDQLAAPTVFLELCLVYPQLDSTSLKAALQHTVDAYPALASRLFTNPQVWTCSMQLELQALGTDLHAGSHIITAPDVHGHHLLA
jgi:hypothetical protein